MILSPSMKRLTEKTKKFAEAVEFQQLIHLLAGLGLTFREQALISSDAATPGKVLCLDPYVVPVLPSIFIMADGAILPASELM